MCIGIGVVGNSLLTVKNLSSNRVPSVSGDSDDNDTILSSDVASLTISDGALSIRSTASSVRTMASGWSQVSHNAFERQASGNLKEVKILMF